VEKCQTVVLVSRLRNTPGMGLAVQMRLTHRPMQILTASSLTTARDKLWS